MPRMLFPIVLATILYTPLFAHSAEKNKGHQSIGLAFNPYGLLISTGQSLGFIGNEGSPDGIESYISAELNFPLDNGNYELVLPLLYNTELNSSIKDSSMPSGSSVRSRVVSADIVLRKHFKKNRRSSRYIGGFIRYTLIRGFKSDRFALSSIYSSEKFERNGLGVTFGIKKYNLFGHKNLYWGLNFYLGTYLTHDTNIENTDHTWQYFGELHNNKSIVDIEFMKFGYEF